MDLAVSMPTKGRRPTDFVSVDNYYPQLLWPQKSQTAHIDSHRMELPHSSHFRWKGGLRLAALEATASSKARAIASGQDSTSTPLLDFFATAADMHLMPCDESEEKPLREGQ